MSLQNLLQRLARARLAVRIHPPARSWWGAQRRPNVEMGLKYLALAQGWDSVSQEGMTKTRIMFLVQTTMGLLGSPALALTNVALR